MKFRTIHNRVERNEFIFDVNDVKELLKAKARTLLIASHTAASAVTWDVDFDIDYDTYAIKGATVTQSFEYLSPAVEQPMPVGAVDPSATDPGKPTTRDD